MQKRNGPARFRNERSRRCGGFCKGTKRDKKVANYFKQVFKDDEMGDIQFIDLNERTPSAKCKVSDIKLSQRFERETAQRLRREIADDINNNRSAG